MTKVKYEVEIDIGEYPPEYKIPKQARINAIESSLEDFVKNGIFPNPDYPRSYSVKVISVSED